MKSRIREYDNVTSTYTRYIKGIVTEENVRESNDNYNDVVRKRNIQERKVNVELRGRWSRIYKKVANERMTFKCLMNDYRKMKFHAPLCIHNNWDETNRPFVP